MFVTTCTRFLTFAPLRFGAREFFVVGVPCSPWGAQQHPFFTSNAGTSHLHWGGHSYLPGQPVPVRRTHLGRICLRT